MKPSFEKTVDVLVKAYLNDTLNRGTCSSCAVGNIIRAAGVIPTADWHKLGRGLNPYGLEQIEKTGYTPKEIDMIESAFMGWGMEYGDDPSIDNFDALMRTVDVLADIHGVDLTVKKSAKLLFVKS